MTITSKSTKAEILAAYEAVSAAYAADRAQAVVPTITTEAVANTVRLVAREAAALIRDVFALAAWCRKGFDQVLDIYAQPVLVKK